MMCFGQDQGLRFPGHLNSSMVNVQLSSGKSFGRINFAPFGGALVVGMLC